MSDSLPPGLTPEELEALRARAKEELRRRLAALRRAVSSETRMGHSSAIAQQVLAEPAFAHAEVVLAYSALRFEVDPRPIIERAWARGKRVLLPRTVPETRALVLHAYEEGDELVESGFVVKEPLSTAPVVPASEVDLVLVPGLGFDVRGHRLGYGQGYYDRVLPALARATSLGLAFELSMLIEVPSAPHDVPVDLVVTEKRVIRCAREGTSRASP